MTHIEHFSHPEGSPPAVGYSHAVAGTGRFVAIAGQVAMDENGELFGEERLQQLLLTNAHLSAAELREKIIAAVTDFGNGSFYDDVTLLVLKIG